MTPIITDRIGGYLVEWPDSNLEAKISRIHLHQDGHVSGLLQLTHNNGTGKFRLLPNTQFNFSAELTRNKYAKQLATKYEQLEIEWLSIFDYLGEAIQERAFSGAPSEAIRVDKPTPGPDLLINPLIYRGHQNILFGEKGVNKSTYAYALAICLALPEWDNPLCLQLVKEPIITLVLDWETDRPTFEWYISRLRLGMNSPPFTIHYRRCRLPLAEDIEPIAEEVEKTGAKLLLIDSLGAAASGESGELKGSQAALQFNSALRYLPGITSLIIGQTSKSSEPGNKTIFGSTYFTYYARNIFELYKGKEEVDSYLIGLTHRECNFNRKHRPMSFSVKYQPQAISITEQPYNINDFVERVSTSSLILQALKNGAMTAQELQTATGAEIDTIYQNTRRLKDKGKIIELPGKKWGLAYEEEAKLTT